MVGGAGGQLCFYTSGAVRRGGEGKDWFNCHSGWWWLANKQSDTPKG